MTTHPDRTSLIYPQAMLFTVLKEDGRLHRWESSAPIRSFGLGEAHAIALAREQSWMLLINDSRPMQLAQSLGVHCVSVPAFCTLLYAERKITLAAVRGYMRRLAATTNSHLIRQAEKLIETTAEARGETS